MSGRLLPIVLAAGVAWGALAAETYPVKPVRLIVPFPPGGFVDLGARVVAGPLGAALGQQVVVDNRGGAAGIVGTELAARAAPDGHVLVVGSAGTHGVNQSLYRKLPYDVLRDRLNAQGAEPAPMPADAFAAFVKSGVAKWAKVVAATGMTAD